MKKVYFTEKFPSISHPVYCEIRNENPESFGYGHVEYWNAFHDVTEMKDFLSKLFKDSSIVYLPMR